MAKKTMKSITNKASYGRRMVPEYLIKKLEEGPVKLKDITNITTLTDDEINSLEAGDIVLKKTGNQYHTYIVSYKEEGQGICLSYFNAGYSETVSFDYVDGEWVYNSTDISNTNLIEEIHDENGNLRFIEGDINTEEITGVSFDIAKFSLSGTHLMFVLAGSVENGTSLENNKRWGSLTIPQWIYNKIFELGGGVVETKGFNIYNSTVNVLSNNMYYKKERGKG